MSKAEVRASFIALAERDPFRCFGVEVMDLFTADGEWARWRLETLSEMVREGVLQCRGCVQDEVLFWLRPSLGEAHGPA